MKRSNQNHKPNRATRNAVAHLNHLVAEMDLRRQVIDDQGGTVAAYTDTYGDAGPGLYGNDRRALRIVEREFASLTH